MTTPTPSPYTAPSGPAVAASATDGTGRWRWLLSGVIGILGGYLTLLAISGGLLPALAGFAAPGPEYTILLVAQTVFAVVVTAFAYALAPGSVGRRWTAIAIYVVGVVLTILLALGRITGGIPGGAVMGFFLNAFWLVLLFGALGWLIACGARPLAYLGLLLTVILLPVSFGLIMNGFPSAASNGLQFALALVIAIVILILSRPARGVAVAPATAPAASVPADGVTEVPPMA